MRIIASCLVGLLSLSLTKATELTSPEENGSQKAQEQETFITDKILLQALDKVTGHVITLEAEMNKPIAFGTLSIIPRFCQKAAPEDPPESTAFLEILETQPKSPEMFVFQGWMFASHPSISALEHPVYDIWVKECSGTTIKSQKVSSLDLPKTKAPLSDELKAFYEGLGENPETSHLRDEQEES
ncbi:MAG: hypothetical protein BGO77_07320 [Caedibacter sp. 37-49]|nr:MAG: hypothetical protein BGO77_07320 [Caedibacter sp. 37-49]